MCIYIYIHTYSYYSTKGDEAHFRELWCDENGITWDVMEYTWIWCDLSIGCDWDFKIDRQLED